MNDRKSSIEKIVTSIPNIQKRDSISSEEAFQNDVLRPILKFQNDLFVCYVNKVILNKAKIKPATELKEAENKLKSILSNDLQVRNTLLGMVLGLMTSEQLCEYLKNESAFKKRIFSMMRKRIVDIIT